MVLIVLKMFLMFFSMLETCGRFLSDSILPPAKQHQIREHIQWEWSSSLYHRSPCGLIDSPSEPRRPPNSSYLLTLHLSAACRWWSSTVSSEWRLLLLISMFVHSVLDRLLGHSRYESCSRYLKDAEAPAASCSSFLRPAGGGSGSRVLGFSEQRFKSLRKTSLYDLNLSEQGSLKNLLYRPQKIHKPTGRRPFWTG